MKNKAMEPIEHFKIDFFELMFLAEACIPPVPIARGYFWDSLTDKHYSQMSKGQRKKAFEWLSRRINDHSGWKDSMGSINSIQMFLNRFDPNNQYRIYTKFDGKEEWYDTFLHKGKYHTTRNTHIAEQWITKVEKIEQ